MGAKSQEESRVDVIMYDQWGRPWHATLEKETMTPTGPVQPLFSAPFIPDQKYHRYGGKRNPVRMQIDLAKMEEDLQEAHEERERLIRKLTMQFFPGWNKKAPPPEVIEKVDGPGYGPMPLEVLWAAMQGNKWILGFSKRRPAWSEAGAVSTWFDPPEKESFRRKREMEFPDSPEDAEDAAEVELVDEDTIPARPGGELQGVPEGVLVGAEHSSWGGIPTPEEMAIAQPQTSVRNPQARKE